MDSKELKELRPGAFLLFIVLAGIGLLVLSSSSPTINGVDESGEPVSFPNPNYNPDGFKIGIGLFILGLIFLGIFGLLGINENTT